MPATPFDSAHLSGLFDAGEVARLFTDSAEIRALMLVEGTLAKVQGEAGLIPDTAARAIHRASLELQIDPAALAGPTAQNGVCIPALVAAFRKEMNAPDHAQYLHWGATSQDILDTGLMLRLRQALSLIAADLDATLEALATLAETHAGTPMAARTWGQIATPTSFGAVAAGWGWPLLDVKRALPGLCDRALVVSLSGAAGTASELGPTAPVLRAALAQALGLTDPGRSWHGDRTPVIEIVHWLARLTTALGKLGEDLIRATQSGIAEIALSGAGGSSTMPQKQNPVGPSLLVALARHNAALLPLLHQPHLQARDGAAWMGEWLALPQIVLGAATAIRQSRTLVETMAPLSDAMRAALTASGGLVLAEALSFALANTMPRPDAQDTVKALCASALQNGRPLSDLAMSLYPDLPADFFDPTGHMGQAPEDARAFAQAVRSAT
ncbi:adenylosuccinate lyase family protein [Thalassococcus sp. CAU 1522]|uniref:Adenylosuccinate lyase family protein n=1 Tax=Thalassococcus arenae TaxID=2851652 RepID=A0ABS6N7U9_9RHOB|nr:lyase family protein [Thalassococcus arenae]MBV2360097.1 adenylosuccinate lyase family protein [Thalassococcus arenae]